jgi:hypothetical protein
MTLIVAAVGKITSSRRSVLELGVGLFELGLALALASRRIAQEVALIAVCLSAVFAFRAILASPRERCQCFGRWLPSSGLLAQRIRNIALFLFAFAYFGTFYAGRYRPAQPLVDLAAGLIIGVAIVLLPWLLEWALVQNDQAAKYSTH